MPTAVLPASPSLDSRICLIIKSSSETRLELFLGPVFESLKTHRTPHQSPPPRPPVPLCSGRPEVCSACSPVRALGRSVCGWVVIPFQITFYELDTRPTQHHRLSWGFWQSCGPCWCAKCEELCLCWASQCLTHPHQGRDLAGRTEPSFRCLPSCLGLPCSYTPGTNRALFLLAFGAH